MLQNVFFLHIIKLTDDVIENKIFEKQLGGFQAIRRVVYMYPHI